MAHSSYRNALMEYIRAQAQPPDKFSHQARLYHMARTLANEEARTFDEDVLFAAAWLHDLGVFVGHRPADLTLLANWDHVAYVTKEGPPVLRKLQFPEDKIPAVLEVIRTHLPTTEPTCFEGVVLRDADLLEQLGAVGIMRTVSKVGRDTRFVRFDEALRVLHRNLEQLPSLLKLESARRHAVPRVRVLQEFLTAAELEASGIPW